MLVVFLGLTLVVTRTLKSMYRAEPEIFPGVMLFTAQGMRYFIHHLRHLMFRTPVQAWRKYGGASHGKPDPDSFLAVLDALFKWARTWLPSGEIGTLGSALEIVVEEKRTSTSSVLSSSSSTNLSVSSGKSSSKKRTKSKNGGNTSTVTNPPPTVITQQSSMKRHSLPHIQPVKTDEVVEADSDGFVPVRRDRLASGEFTPVSSPSEKIEFKAIVEEPSEDEVEETIINIPRNVRMEDVESKFEKYFNSDVKSVETAKHRPSLDSTETKLKSADLTPPPGFNGRRTKSVASTKYVPPHLTNPNLQQQSQLNQLTHQSTKTSSVSVCHHHCSAGCNPPPGHPNHNPNTTSCTGYRRPTGTFASKGYMITSESVFAARVSPVPENAPPLDKRAKDFFQQRKSVSRTSTPISSTSTTPPSSPKVRGSPEKARFSSSSGSAGSLFEPMGQRKSLFSIWNPYIDEDSVVPPGAHLKPAGIIGSRPSSTSQGTADEKKDEYSEYNEHFSLFNMELFRNTPGNCNGSGSAFSSRKSFE